MIKKIVNHKKINFENKHLEYFRKTNEKQQLEEKINFKEDF